MSYLLSIYNDKDECNHPISHNDSITLTKYELEMKNNYTKRLYEIKSCIKSNIAKHSSYYPHTKKYIIKNKYMYFQLKKYIKLNNLRCNAEYLCDTKHNTSKLSFINPSHDSKCCSSCDSYLSFDNTTKHLEYIVINYNFHNEIELKNYKTHKKYFKHYVFEELIAKSLHPSRILQFINEFD